MAKKNELHELEKEKLKEEIKAIQKSRYKTEQEALEIEKRLKRSIFLSKEFYAVIVVIVGIFAWFLLNSKTILMTIQNVDVHKERNEALSLKLSLEREMFEKEKELNQKEFNRLLDSVNQQGIQKLNDSSYVMNREIDSLKKCLVITESELEIANGSSNSIRVKELELEKSKAEKRIASLMRDLQVPKKLDTIVVPYFITDTVRNSYYKLVTKFDTLRLTHYAWDTVRSSSGFKK